MWFVDAFAAEGQSLLAKRYLVRAERSDAANFQRKPEFKTRPKSPVPPEGRKFESAECSEELDETSGRHNPDNN